MLWKRVFCWSLFLLSSICHGIEVLDYGVRNGAQFRNETKYIILHTTEGYDSYIGQIHQKQLANFVIDTFGVVHMTLNHEFMAFHAGHSMWSKDRNLNELSLGIEIVGFHDVEINIYQKRALKGLVEYLQSVYPRVKDKNILTHSMVAVDEHFSRRGRKRCAMKLNSHSFRHNLGIGVPFNSDPNVESGELRVVDNDLYKQLYSHETVESTNFWHRLGSFFNSKEGKPPAQNSIFYLSSGQTIYSVLGKDFESEYNFLIFKEPKLNYGFQLISTQELLNYYPEIINDIPEGTVVLKNFSFLGELNFHLKQTAYQLTNVNEGVPWNNQKVFYYFDGKFQTGNKVKESDLYDGTLVFLNKSL